MRGIAYIVLLLGLVACERGVLEYGGSSVSHVGEGQFVVDYSGEVRTRAIHENVEKGVRINSLTYLLYMDEGEGQADAVLLKRREIPGLNEQGTVENWPLTRENMTWEQREALKDTLDVGNTYYAVFVANAAPELWNADETDNPESPLKNADLPTDETETAPTYSEAYLQLPENMAFNDRNMFYLATQTIEGTTATRDNPVNCPVTLKRIVTRTDWWFERLPEVKFPDSEADVTWDKDDYPMTKCELDSNLQGYLYNLMFALSEEVMEGSVRTDVINGTVAMLEEVKAYWDGKVTSLPGQETEDEKIYQGYADAVGDMINAIKGDGQEYFWQKLSTEMTTGEQPVEKLSTHLRNVLLTLAGSNQTLQRIWKASWRLADAEAGKEATVTKAQVTYQSNTLGDKYYLSQPVTAAMTTSPWIPFDAATTVAGYNYEGFNWVGFAHESGNIAETITLGNEVNDIVETFTVGENAAQTAQETNYWYQVRYRPIASIASGSEKKVSIPIQLDLEAALPFTQTGEDLEALKEAILTALNEEKAEEEAIESLEAYWLTVEVPNLQDEIVITPSWSNPEQVNR